MVKADLTRDYYADLELQPGASDTEIKKQFRTLALKYHPDRNPGREAEVNSKFQTIQSAHEVLTDPDQKAKYDSGRVRGNNTRAYDGFRTSQPTASGTRGNPWANAGSQWAPPPKPPPPKDAERRKAPPPSAGAQRYASFTTANGTAPKASSDAEARRKNYQAWESMRQQQQQPPRPWQPPKPVPKEYTPQSGREESNSYKHPPPPKSSRPGYDEFRAGASSSQSDRTSPSRPPRKSGFMPATPGPDERPASSSSTYFSRTAGRPSSRKQAEPAESHRTKPPIDPLRQFREQAGTPYEPRLSTPYATHGGEKTNPFESININRSKSARVPSDKTNSARTESPRPSGTSDRHRSASPTRSKNNRNLSPEPGITRADSEMNLGSSPKRTFSGANRAHQPSPSKSHTRFAPVNLNRSSDGDDSDSDKRQPAFGTRSRTFAKRRQAPATARPKDSQASTGGPESSAGDNDDRLHGNSSTRGNADNDDGIKENMYDNPASFTYLRTSASKNVSPLPTILEERFAQFSERQIPQAHPFKYAASSEAFATFRNMRPDLVTPLTYGSPPGSPSGAPRLTPPGYLTAFETTQRRVVEQLLTRNGLKPEHNGRIHNDVKESFSKYLGTRMPRSMQPEVNEKPQKEESISVSPDVLCGSELKRAAYSEHLCGCGCGKTGSPFRKRRGSTSHAASPHEEASSTFLNTDDSIYADKKSSSSFSFKVPEEPFSSPGSHDPSFNNSAENISTKFSAEDWHGKFQAGDYLKNNGPGMNGHSRTRSRSRTRARSPVKGWAARKSQVPPVPNIDQQTTDSDPVLSPGGTKFTADEWAETFNKRTFEYPPYPPGSSTARPSLRTARRSRTGSSTTKPANTTRTAGNSAMVDEDESSESPLEMGSRKNQSTNTAQGEQGATPISMDSPNAMDIDSPPEQQSETPKAGQNGSMPSHDSACNVPLEPSRPEWRAGAASGSDVPTAARKSPNLPPRPETASDRRRTTKSADEEDFKTNFEDLKNVEPMRHPATGLHSFNDLTSTLPFPSRAASTLTIPRNFSSGELDLPNPPRAPVVPPVVNATRPSMASWDSYLVDFKAYMAEWDIFNTKMIIHFVARKNQVDGMKSGWLEAFGDSDLDKYKEGLIEDMKVRQHWDVACDKHQAAIEKFQFFKGCLREGAPGAGRGAKIEH